MMNPDKNSNGDPLTPYKGEEPDSTVETQEVEAREVEIIDDAVHSGWHKMLLATLIVVFFPWSILVTILLAGWDNAVLLFRDLVMEIVAIVVTVVVIVLIIGFIGLLFVLSG